MFPNCWNIAGDAHSDWIVVPVEIRFTNHDQREIT
ncbi:hypothetical protein CO709_05070 [Burkholderia thailandensis]|nr:hypothetical protein CO709_05070 [Burkholderia thailandensis]